MTLKYTTTEDIARRLRGRLQLVDAPVVTTSLGSAQTYGPTIGGQIVDPELLDQLGRKKEAYVDWILQQIYELPLSLQSDITKEILADIVECLVCSAILKVHFQGSLNMSTGGDVQGLGIDMDKQAYMLLGCITVGHNIYLPVSYPPLPSTFPGAMPPQPLVLPLETLKTGETQPDTIHKVYTFVSTRRMRALDQIDWGQEELNLYGPGTGNQGRAKGALTPDF